MSKRKKRNRTDGPSWHSGASAPGAAPAFYLPGPEDLAAPVDNIMSVGGLPIKRRPPLDIEVDLEGDPEEEESPGALFSQIRTCVDLLCAVSIPDREMVLKAGVERLPGPKRRELSQRLATILEEAEKEVQAMPSAQLARHLARFWYGLPAEVFCGITVIGVNALYRNAALEVLKSVTDDYLKNEELLERARGDKSELLWNYAVWSVAEEPGVARVTRDRVQRTLITRLPRVEELPFQPTRRARLNALEEHLYQLQGNDPAKAKRLAEALLELHPGRARTWFLLGLMGHEPGRPPAELLERAWNISGQLFAFGNDPENADRKDEAPWPEEDVVRAILNAPELAEAREMVGEYLLAVAEARDSSLFMDLISKEVVEKYPLILLYHLLLHSERLASNGEVERMKSVAGRFPVIRSLELLPRALRRAGRFQEALAELDAIGSKKRGERMLCEAGIDDLRNLQVPEDRGGQLALSDKLMNVSQLWRDEQLSGPEGAVCLAIAGVLNGRAEACADAYEQFATQGGTGCEHFALLAALMSQDPALMTECFSRFGGDEAPAVLAEHLKKLPRNLVRAGIRNLLMLEEPHIAAPFLDALYGVDPEALDPLVSNPGLLAASRGVLRRQVDGIGRLPTANQKWFALQVALEHARKLQDEDTEDAIVDACLEFKEPHFMPLQVELLNQEIAAATKEEDRELFIHRLCEISPAEAKPHLYQLLRSHLGQQRFEAAEDVLDTLELAGEEPAALKDYRAVIAAAREKPKASIPAVTPIPARVLFIGGDESDRGRSEQLRQELSAAYPGLEVAFEHSGWNVKNLGFLLAEVPKHDIVVVSPLMRTTTYRRVHRQALQLGKVFGACRGRGMSGMRTSVLEAVKRYAGTARSA